MYSKLKTLVIAAVTLFITLIIIVFPEKALEASVHGLHTWWEIVFPSLLPFFIVAELLTSFGVVQFFGVLFEPIMRPLFNVPGVGSFAWILGMVSGFPSGAKITVLLRERKEISQIEAERLLSFSNASSPLFIFGAIAVGFFHNVQLGIIIAISHYISNIFVGFMMKYYQFEKNDKLKREGSSFSFVFRKAFSRMHRTRISETRPFGELIGDAVISSIQTLLMVGGFIILFSVFTSLLHEIHLMTLIEWFFYPLLSLFQIPIDAVHALITGLFEITMGANAVSKTTISIEWQIVLISIILGFNGFSIQAQVASLIAKTDIRFYPYFIARVTHAFLAAIISFIIFKMFVNNENGIVDTMNLTKFVPHFIVELTDFLKQFGPLFTLSSISIACFILLYRACKK